MDEHPPIPPSQLPPPFDWSRYTPPAGQHTIGVPSPPTAGPPSPSGQEGGGRRRHPAHRSRVAVAVASGVTFLGLVGCAALASGGDDETSTTTATQDPATQDPSATPPTTVAPDDDSYGGNSYGNDSYDRDSYGGDSYGYSEPDWGGSAAPGSGPSGSGPSSQGPDTSSQGS